MQVLGVLVHLLQRCGAWGCGASCRGFGWGEAASLLHLQFSITPSARCLPPTLLQSAVTPSAVVSVVANTATTTTTTTTAVVSTGTTTSVKKLKKVFG